MPVDHAPQALVGDLGLPDFIMSVLEENEHISTHEQTSQYSRGGPSACGLASMNAVRSVLVREKEGLLGMKLLEEINSRTLMEVRCFTPR
jgi:hypothetical protein